MSISILAIGLMVPCFSFVLQIWPRLINRYFGIDTWRHLMFADYVRKNGKLPLKITTRYLVEAPFGYPPVIILFLSLFPKKFADKYQFLFSPFFDFLSNYLFFIAGYLLTKNITIAIVAQIIASLTPILVLEASNLSTRTISSLVFNLSFFPLILYTSTHNIYWLIISIILLFILFFTHKLAIQAYLFNAIGFSIIEKNPLYVLMFIVVFLLVWILGGDLYKRMFTDHMTILNYWRKRIEFRFAHQFRGVPKSKKSFDFIQKIFVLSLKNPFVYIVGNNPWLVLFFIIYFWSRFVVSDYSPLINLIIYNKLILWVLLSFLASVLVLSIKKLRFLGEGNRYVEYCIFPISILIASYFPFLVSFFGIGFVFFFFSVCLTLLISIIYIQKKTILEDRARTISKELWNVIHFLNKKEGKRVRLAVFPFNLGDAMMYFLKGRVLTSDSVLGLLQLTDVFPVVTKPMYEIVKKYQLSHVLFDKNYVGIEEMKLGKYKIEKDLGGYMLVKVKGN